MADGQDELDTNEIDINAASDTIGADLGLTSVEDDPPPADDPPAGDPPAGDPPADPPVTAAPVREFPKSWTKDQQAVWDTMSDAAKDQVLKREKQIVEGLDAYKDNATYGKTMREAIKPFEGYLQSQNVDATKAVQYLLGAHYRLTQGTPESKLAAYQELGKNLGLTPADPNQPPADPTVNAALDRISKLEQSLTARQQAELNEARGRVSKEVEAFASDPAHPYFDEVSDDITIYIGAGMSLQDAYERAVWANPVTRAKEQARVAEDTEKKLRENARLNALKARKASSTNVKSRDTTRAPTEPLGTMEDTMKETLAVIRERAH